jgi:RND family efflux transporter MFP subunit
MQQTVPVLGRLVARQAGVVSARTRGAVAELPVEVGDRVEKGAVIAVLARERLAAERELRAAEVAQARASVETARAQLAFVSQELKRLQNLRKSAAFSQARYEDKTLEVAKAQKAIGEAEAALTRAQVNLKLAEIELRDAEIKAPFAGAISIIHTEVGSYLSTGDDVVTLIDDLHLEIEADVPASRIDGLTPGTRVDFTLNDGPSLHAGVRAVVPDENPLTRTRTVRFVPEFNGERNLTSNQSVTLHLPAGDSRRVLSVHKDAVIAREGNNIVFVVADGKAERRMIRIGEAIGSRFEVLAGLKEGDLAVVRGNERLRPGQQVVARESS